MYALAVLVISMAAAVFVLPELMILIAHIIVALH